LAKPAVTLTPAKAFVLSAPVRLTIDGPPAGQQDSAGPLIGGNDGAAGGTAVAVLSKFGVKIEQAGSGAVNCWR
jgi:hypothetical protein